MFMTFTTCITYSYFLFYCDDDHRYLHVLTHSFPTRRSSDLWRVMPTASHSWNASVPISAVDTWPVSTTIGIESSKASVMPVTALVAPGRSEEHTSELQSLMRISYAVFCLQKKNKVHIRQ